MSADVSVFVVDDHQMMVDGILSLLDKMPGFKAIGTAADGLQAQQLIERDQPQILITDINMPQVSGLELTKWVRKRFPGVKVLVLSMYNDDGIVGEIMAAGAQGYILKNTGKDELQEALQSLVDGNTFYTKQVVDTMIRNIQGRDTPTDKSHINSAELTPREKEIVLLIVGERSNAEIAEELFISLRTVETHRKNIIRKTGVKNVAGLIRYAHQHQIA